jgi:hypothetical protein
MRHDNGKNLTAARRMAVQGIGAVGVGVLMACIAIGASADMASPQSAPAAQSKAQLTFPPSSDCAFLGGEAGQACEQRRAGHATELEKVRNGEIKTLPPAVTSSGGTYTPLSNQGGLGGLSEMSPIGPSEQVAPAPSKSFNANSIGNPWSGTPYDNGTGTH